MQTQPVELVGIYGDDLSPAQAAWYSTASSLTDEKLKRVPAMLRTLAIGDPPENLPHSVPFEHTLIQFSVTAEIASHIHILKHRIGVSVSSQSQRYMEIKEDLYYIPDDWPSNLQAVLKAHALSSFDLYHRLIDDLEAAGINRKRAKESARFALTYATQIHFLISFNLLSFVHFQLLRNSQHAQDEIRLIADEMLNQVKATERFPNSLGAWGL